MESLEKRVEECERRILVLEKFREKDLEINYKTKDDVSKAIVKMEDLIDTVGKLPADIEKSLTKSLDLMKKEHESMMGSIAGLQKNYQEFKEETEIKIEELQKLINERTVIQDSKDFNKIKMTIITAIITGIVSFVIGLLVKM